MGEYRKADDSIAIPEPSIAGVTSGDIENYKTTNKLSSQCSSSDGDNQLFKTHLDKKKIKSKSKKKINKSEDSQEDKLKRALEEEERQQAEATMLLSMDERKRPYNSMFEVKKPTDEEIEAYYLKRRREEDPMNQFM